MCIRDSPNAEEMANIAKMAETVVKTFAIEPRIAMLSYENFSSNAEVSKKVSKAVEILHQRYPKMIVDGEIQPDFAMDSEPVSYTHLDVYKRQHMKKQEKPK